MNMENQPAPVSVSSYLPTAAILIILGWGGLYATILYTTPNGGTRWLFFFLLILAVTGTILPLVAFLHRHFSSTPPVTHVVVIRQALWFGVFVATLAWLQIGRVLNPTLALLLAVGLLIIEWLLRLRERSQWKP
jgi:hypothetical protein